MKRRLVKLFLLVCGLASGVYVLLLLTKLTSTLPAHTVYQSFIAAMDIRHNTARELVNKTTKESASIRDSPKNESKKAGNSTEAEAKKLSNEAPNVTRSKPVSNEASQNASDGTKYVVFVCDEREQCNGWGDRQRGLMGVYALSIVTRRKFGIIMTVPCNITNFYLPNRVNWIIPDHELRGKSSISIMDIGSKAKIRTRLASMDFNAKYPQDVVYIRTNEDYWDGIRKHRVYKKRLPVWARGASSKFFFHGWHTLMKPAERLAKRLQDFLHRIDFSLRTQLLACAHVRMGRSETLKTDTLVRCNISDIPVLWKFLDGWVKKGSHVFLATDSVKVRNMTRARFGDRMHDTGDVIQHVDQDRDLPNACQGFESALLDQLILTQCDVLVTSKSVYSERTAFMRGQAGDLFHFENRKVSKRKI